MSVMLLLDVVPIPWARGRLSVKFVSGLWHVAQDTFLFPLKRVSKKSFFPKEAAFGLSENAFEGSSGTGGREPIQSVRKMALSFSDHPCRSSAMGAPARKIESKDAVTMRQNTPTAHDLILIFIPLLFVILLTRLPEGEVEVDAVL
jgi:hypothetical protein